jgi:hypothetical protein
MPVFPSVAEVTGVAAVTLIVITVFGRAVSARFLPDVGHSLLIGPTVGLGLHIVLLFPLGLAFGFSVPVILAVLAANLLTAWWIAPPRQRIDPWLLAFVGACAIVAAWPAATAVPHVTDHGVFIGETIFDRGKVPIADEIARNGIYPSNPYFGGPNGARRLIYYYLWYVPAAELRLLFGISGWAADIALTWITGFCSLLVMGAIAIRLTGSVGPAWWILPLSLSSTLRPLVASWFGSLDGVLHDRGELLAWLRQAGWVPHHVLATAITVLTTLTFWQLINARALQTGTAAVTGLLGAAALGCSTWVGGLVQFILLGMVMLMGVLMHRSWPALRIPVANAAIAGAVAVACAVPLLVPQLGILDVPRKAVKILLFPVFAPTLFGGNALADFFGYWAVRLPLDLAPVYVGGLLGLLGVGLLARNASAGLRRDLPVWLVLAIVPFLATQFLQSTLANNDLGWRAFMVGLFVLTGWSAVVLRHLFDFSRLTVLAVVPAILMVASLPSGLIWLGSMSIPALNTRPMTEQHRVFASDPEIWAAVRRHTLPRESVLNNARSRDEITPWPANIGWALLSDRRSCIAGWEWLRAYALLRRDRLVDIIALSERFFAGDASAADEARLQDELGCRTVLVTPQDGVWRRRALASPERWHLVEEQPDRWRIYRAVGRGGLPRDASR